MSDMKINVEHITRVEGHGNIVLNVKEGKIEELRLEIVDSIGHTTASLHALENGLGIEPSEQTTLMRKFAFYGEMLQSHLLHAYFLAAPDYVGAPSVFPLVKTHPEVVQRALKLKRLANDMCSVIGGRHIHPVSLKVKTLSKLPDKDAVKAVRDRLQDALADLQATVELFKTFKVPQFEREMEFVCLHDPDEYAMFSGDIIRSTTCGDTPLDSYQDQIHEFVVPHSTAKHARSKAGTSYMVGALARFNINYDQLHPQAKEAAEALGLQPMCYNSFHNTTAQVVECVHCAHAALEDVDRLLDMDWVEEDPAVDVKACRCIGAADVPRGLLIHDYTLDDDGYVTAANLVIPTAQNCNNVEQDMYKLVPDILDRKPEEIQMLLEMLVRAYDPCISCSVHLLKVEFV